MCDFLGRMVILKKKLRFMSCCLVWFPKRRDLVAFLRCKHTPQAIGPAASKTQERRSPSTHAAAVSRRQGLYWYVLCALGECVCVWSPTTSGTKGAGPAWLPLFLCGSGGVRDVHVLICTRVVQIGVAVVSPLYLDLCYCCTSFAVLF